MRLVLVDPLGAGKDTQAAILSEKLGVPHISTGDLLRTNIGEGTPLGIEAKSYIDASNLVPNDVIAHMVESRLNEDDVAKGFLLDGPPRTVGRAEELKRLLSNLGTKLGAAAQFGVSEDIVVERMLACDRIGDTKEVIRNRMHVYTSEIAPLLDHYSEKTIKIVAEGSAEKINERMMAEPEKLS